MKLYCQIFTTWHASILERFSLLRKQKMQVLKPAISTILEQ